MTNQDVVINANSCIKQQKGAIFYDRFYNVCTGQITDVPWNMAAVIGNWIGGFLGLCVVIALFYYTIKKL